MNRKTNNALRSTPTAGMLFSVRQLASKTGATIGYGSQYGTDSMSTSAWVGVITEENLN
jgi:hypothetical protein